ncbi:DUF3500 domain-containing protein [Phragmitibacter flavus]|uniref:DUF3500 domain-containing protein n=1 Tax=Phragmitibacter flavus TaxID=2576071 RepID=A0A5R8KJ31_9BACT|nr:DUF3500 domain-containing protein [Phragmitibacter flavus]TLD72324.1 DUF3500 domain-containing protein [Phragmitibacter flavus]
MPRFALLLFLASLTTTVFAHEKVADDMARAANTFTASLNAEQKTKTLFPFESEERVNWHFVPRERKGLSFRDMTEAQQKLAHTLINTGLSAQGYRRVNDIISLEDLLFEIESATRTDPKDKASVRERRNPAKYHLSIFGEPSMKSIWGWRFEGHHLSLNYTIKNGHLLRTAPHFFGSNPAEIRQGPRAGLRVLAEEEDHGRTLAASLNDQQWKQALVSEKAYPDILTGNSRKAKTLEPLGLSTADFSESQTTYLQQLVRTHLFRMRPEVAEDRWKEILTEGPLHFAWAGSRKPNEPHYYRVQGKSFLLEYDNTQNNANHIHTVWRDFNGDFGDDLLRQHLEQDHGLKK